MKKILLFAGALSLSSLELTAQDLVEPNQTIPPFSMPNDCLVLQYNSGVLSKKIMQLYSEIDSKLIKNLGDKSIENKLNAIKKLSDINMSIAKTYEVFCIRR